MKYSQITAKIKTKGLPDAPGVYFFMEGKKILYIGRATSLRDRVKSYFKSDIIHTRGVFIADMVTLASDLEVIRTDSVLEAIILEANLIKKYQPHYNTKEKDDKSFNYVIITREDFPRVLVIRGKDLDEYFPKNKLRYVFGPYPQGGVLKEGMKIIRRIFPFRDKCVPFTNTEKVRKGGVSGLAGKPCFNRQIGLCPGVCTGEISKREYASTILSLKLFFEGKKGQLIRELERQMKAYSKLRKFEQANQVKKTLFALSHIQDISLIKEETREKSAPEIATGTGKDKNPGQNTLVKPAFRIEAYDIAHTSGQSTVGVMVVMEDQHIKRSDYRMFKIRTNSGLNNGRGGSDVAALKEVLDRRLNHPEWPYPNLMVMDGGIAQKNAAEELLKQRNFDIAVVSVVKNEHHRPDRILEDPRQKSQNSLKYSKEILLANSEAHRFALKYHRKIRGACASKQYMLRCS